MKKKIMFIIPSFRRGGVERVTLNILNSLDPSKYDVYLVICKTSDNDLLSNLHTPVKVVKLEKNSIRDSFFSIVKTIRNIEPQIVFTSFDHLSLAIILVKIVVRNQFEIVVRINSLPSNNLKSNFRDALYRLFFRKLIRKADMVVAQSQQMKNDISGNYKMDASRIKVIQNLVDTGGIKKSAEEKVLENIKTPGIYTFISIGSLGHVKGYDLLIQAVNNLILSGKKNLRFYIIGDNREKNENCKEKLVDMIRAYSLQDYIVLLGYKKNPYPYLKQVDALVLPSRNEGFPNVVLEALTLGKPCLVTNCIDFESIIENCVNGLIVEKNNVRALEAGIEEIQRIKRIDKLEIRNFDYNKWFENIEV